MVDIKIEYTNELLYQDLTVGDIFTYHYDAYIVTNQHDCDEPSLYVSVNLSNGHVSTFRPKITVRKFDSVTCILK